MPTAAATQTIKSRLAEQSDFMFWNVYMCICILGDGAAEHCPHMCVYKAFNPFIILKLWLYILFGSKNIYTN